MGDIRLCPIKDLHCSSSGHMVTPSRAPAGPELVSGLVSVLNDLLTSKTHPTLPVFAVGGLSGFWVFGPSAAEE